MGNYDKMIKKLFLDNRIGQREVSLGFARFEEVLLRHLSRKKIKKIDEVRFFRDLDSALKNLDKLSQILSELELIKTKRLFRKIFLKNYGSSYFLSRGLSKPRGYAGDYIMLEGMYDNQPKAESTGHGPLFDKYYLRNDYVQAVRERKDFMKRYLKLFLSKNLEPDILNLACGACREIREIYEESPYMTERRIRWHLVDHDAETIRFARKQLSTHKYLVCPKFVCDDVLRFLNKGNGKFDLIYSIGLFDYLPDSILGPLIFKCFKALRKGGCFVLAHKNVTKFSAPAPDWLCNWRFIPRDKDAVHSLIKDRLKVGFKLQSRMEKQGRIFYFIVKKL